MKSIRFALMSSLTLALLGASMGARANAQGLTGNFTLPFTAHWGMATLQPGDYSFKAASVPGGKLFVYRGKRAVAMIYAQGFGLKTSGPNVLVVERDEAASTIRQMVVPSIGLVLYYPAHKPKHGSVQEERQAGLRIPIVETAGGQ
ncbi:MAG TPA: hypothetical protein VMU80_20560 [Bryobacteraceae bacterium]|nr:hypothetical protein [Bryobacteraceae bacterium]